MLDKGQFLNLISYVLDQLGLYSLSAVNLLMGTAAQESDFGTYLRQIGGSARGIFRMEPEIEKDIWKSFLRYHPCLRHKVIELTHIKKQNLLALEANLAYQICMARLHYYRIDEHLPSPDDIDGLAEYYKKYFNTPSGMATQEQFKRKYRRFVLKGKSPLRKVKKVS